LRISDHNRKDSHPNSADLSFYAASQADSDLLLTWANDPGVRAASGDRPPIQYAEHEKWLEGILQDPHSRLMMVRQAHAVVGVVRIIHAVEYHEISWTVAPEFRGRGIGCKMVAMVTAELSGPLRATVEKSNAASIKVAQAAGFELYQDKENVLFYRRN